jgi:protein TonB
MERPNHLKVADKSVGSRATSIVVVVAIHIAVVFALILALNQGAILKKMAEIKASVDVEKTPPKAPPPPPPDLVKPPPPVAIVPDFQVQTQAPPPVTVQKAAPPPPPAPTHAISNDPLRPIARTHTLPPYPPISVRLNEQGTTLMEVNITAEGNVDQCSVIQTSSSDRLDQAACEFVKSRWRWQPPTLNGAPTAAKTRVSVKWDLKDAK